VEAGRLIIRIENSYHADPSNEKGNFATSKVARGGNDVLEMRLVWGIVTSTRPFASEAGDVQGGSTMRRAVTLGAILFAVSISLSAQVSGRSVGLGVSVGAALPFGGTQSIGASGKASFDWGFYVDIPILETFKMSPSSELYRLGGQNATDVDLAFKFVVPLSTFDLSLGLSPGLSSVANVTAPHLGILGAASFKLVSNLRIFVQGKYVFIFEGGSNMGALHADTGILFNL
jgi:hypothetical protein